MLEPPRAQPSNVFRALMIAIVAFHSIPGAEAAGRAPTRWPSPALAAAQDRGAGDSMSQCRRPDLGNSSYLWNTRGEFLPGCAPDTLYSWRDLSWNRGLTQDHLSDHTSAPSVWPRPADPRFIGWHFWRTPIGTFAYGNSVLRIKLKPGVRFQSISHLERNCSKFQSEANENTVYVPLHALPSSTAIFAEFLICSEGPVESWSVDAPQTVEESLRELAWIIRKPEGRWDAYIPGANRVRVPGYFPWFSTHPDNSAAGGTLNSSFSLFSLVGDHSRERWSYEALVNKLNGIIQRWGNWNRGDGALPAAYLRSRDSAHPSVRRHFESAVETYFHENSIAVGDARFLRGDLPPTRWVAEDAEESSERGSTHL